MVLVVCPLSGHRPRLFFDLVAGLASDHDVHVLAWEDAKDVPVEAGLFGLDENIGYVMDSLSRLGRGVHAVALSQSALPVLAATALLSARNDPAVPETLTLLGGKLDTRINPARIDDLARAHSLRWLEGTPSGRYQHRIADAAGEFIPGKRSFPHWPVISGARSRRVANSSERWFTTTASIPWGTPLGAISSR